LGSFHFDTEDSFFCFSTSSATNCLLPLTKPSPTLILLLKKTEGVGIGVALSDEKHYSSGFFSGF
jgi:hypothetical protein